jgi:hypothetical protein
MSQSKSLYARIVAAVACPRCGAAIGERCHNPIAHQAIRGPADHRAQPLREHSERRRAHQEYRREHERA